MQVVPRVDLAIKSFVTHPHSRVIRKIKGLSNGDDFRCPFLIPYFGYDAIKQWAIVQFTVRTTGLSAFMILTLRTLRIITPRGTIALNFTPNRGRGASKFPAIVIGIKPCLSKIWICPLSKEIGCLSGIADVPFC